MAIPLAPSLVERRIQGYIFGMRELPERIGKVEDLHCTSCNRSNRARFFPRTKFIEITKMRSAAVQRMISCALSNGCGTGTGTYRTKESCCEDQGTATTLYPLAVGFKLLDELDIRRRQDANLIEPCDLGFDGRRFHMTSPAILKLDQDRFEPLDEFRDGRVIVPLTN